MYLIPETYNGYITGIKDIYCIGYRYTTDNIKQDTKEKDKVKCLSISKRTIQFDLSRLRSSFSIEFA